MLKKSLFALLLLVLSSNQLFAQKDPNNNRSTGSAGSCPGFYLGISTGIENPAGAVGINLEAPIGDFSVGGGLGLSSWGWKFFGEARHYFGECNRGWAIGVGVSHNTGLPEMELKDMETDAGKHDIEMTLKPQTNMFIAGYHFFNLGKNGHRFYLQGGYSFRLTSDLYSMKGPFYLKDEAVMEMLAPGGLILGLGFSFALR